MSHINNCFLHVSTLLQADHFFDQPGRRPIDISEAGVISRSSQGWNNPHIHNISFWETKIINNLQRIFSNANLGTTRVELKEQPSTLSSSSSIGTSSNSSVVVAKIALESYHNDSSSSGSGSKRSLSSIDLTSEAEPPSSKLKTEGTNNNIDNNNFQTVVVQTLNNKTEEVLFDSAQPEGLVSGNKLVLQELITLTQGDKESVVFAVGDIFILKEVHKDSGVFRVTINNQRYAIPYVYFYKKFKETEWTVIS